MPYNLIDVLNSKSVEKLPKRSEGECAGRARLIVSGYVREFVEDPLGRPAADGSPRAVSTAIHGPGDVFGLSTVKFDALTAVELKSADVDWAALDAPSLREIMRLQRSQIRFQTDLIIAQHLPVERGVPMTLLAIAEAVGEIVEPRAAIGFHLTHEVLGSFAGTSRELVTAQVGRLVRIKAIREIVHGKTPGMVVDLDILREQILPKNPSKAAA